MAGARPKAASPITRRADPDRQHTQAGIDPTRLERKDPNRRYKWVHQDDRSSNSVRAHEHRGWEIEIGREGGPIPEAGACSKLGEPVENVGYVLMSQPKEEFERVQREGFHGNSGQEAMDRIESQISRRGAAPFDSGAGLRGIADLENTTTPAQHIRYAEI